MSIRQMVENIVIDRGIDRRCVFITGLSAGAAMTSVMLACYPEVFAAGAIIGGVPYGAATNVQQALKSMSQSPARSAQEWGDLVPGDLRAWRSSVRLEAPIRPSRLACGMEAADVTVCL